MAKPRKMLFLFTLFALIVLLVPVDSQGLLRKVELPEMVSRAGTIVHGTVLSNECREDDRGAIFTYTTIAVAEALTGSVAEDQIVIRNMGGKVGDRGLRVSDIPVFEPGEEVILFIEKEPLVEETCLVGWEQGKYSARGGIVDRTGQTVEEFKSEVRRLLAAKESD
jgi:hypothetical protein